MKVNLTRQAWSLVGRMARSSHFGRGSLATISNDASSEFAVQVRKNGDLVVVVDPGRSQTVATSPGDRLEVRSDPKALNFANASGQVLI